MFCRKCGKELAEGVKFCPTCGTPTGDPQQDSGRRPAPQPQGAVQPGTQPPEKPKGKGAGKWIALILGLLLLGSAAAAGTWFFLSGSGKTESAFSGRTEDEEPDDEEQDEETDEEPDEETEEGQETGSGEETPQAEAESGQAGTETAASAQESAAAQTAAVPAGQRQQAVIDIRQVDNSRFPQITFYANIENSAGETVQGLLKADFTVQEVDVTGKVSVVSLSDVHQVIQNADDRISMNLVLDASGSMSSGNKMGQAKNAASSLLNHMDLLEGDRVEIISFDNYVYLQQDYSQDMAALEAALSGIQPNGGTALYDGLYAGLYQSALEQGIRCVVGFTDGAENDSSYTFDDVVNLAQSSGIPVFIIGIGDEYDAAALQDLAARCAGRYYSARVQDLETILSDIYLSIYQEQKDYYSFSYTTTDVTQTTGYRRIDLSMSATAAWTGSAAREYASQTDLSGAFSADYSGQDYIIADSGGRELTASDLAGLSLAQLRIARNEIFARHGRQFKDSMLNQWFYSKQWYLNIAPKYAPDYFDNNHPSPLSSLETKNVNYIIKVENERMASGNIYPDAGTRLLSDYDLSLSKPVLKTALAQLATYPSTDILAQNIQRIQAVINRADIQY